MMKNLRKNKSGISLIVLVITIIVMIILAAAIILSLSNSGIIGKANKAKTDSDTANLKEYVNTLRAEWELMKADEQTAEGSFEAYANKKLEKSGYKGAVGADGEVYSNLNENAMAAIRAGIKVGDVVTGYTVTEKSYTTSGEENTYNIKNYTETDPQPQTVTTNTDITWKYLGVNANGELEIMADLGEEVAADNTKVKLSGKGGYLKGPEMLNTICEKLYSKDGVGTARSMNIDDVNNILGYTGPKGTYYDSNWKYLPTKEVKTIATLESELGTTLKHRTTPDGKDLGTYYSDYYKINKTSDKKEMKNPENVDLVYNAKNTYWLASSCANACLSDSGAHFKFRFVESSDVDACYMFRSDDRTYSSSYAVRPVVKLDPSVKLVKDVTAANTWNISK